MSKVSRGVPDTNNKYIEKFWIDKKAKFYWCRHYAVGFCQIEKSIWRNFYDLIVVYIYHRLTLVCFNTQILKCRNENPTSAINKSRNFELIWKPNFIYVDIYCGLLSNEKKYSAQFLRFYTTLHIQNLQTKQRYFQTQFICNYLVNMSTLYFIMCAFSQLHI